MRIVATENFLMAARSAGRTVSLRYYIKKTSSRSEALSSGTWIDVTDYLSRRDTPTLKNDLEINLSQFSASSITLTGNDIAYWDTTFFSYANFLELKAVMVISSLTADAVTVFAGWIKKKKDAFLVKRSERSNTVKFDVWSYIDFADEVHASTVLRQYVDEDVDGAGTDGLVLPRIKNLFVTDADVASFTLRKGVHTISYQIDGTDKQAKIDDGDWVTLSTGTNTLVNADGDQKVTVYAKTLLPSQSDLSDDIIVDVEGDTLPKNWLYSVSARYLLKKLFEKAGITSVSFDTMEYPTKDGLPKISYMELVADVESITASRTSVASSGSYKWFGVDNKLYRRDANGEYTLMQTLTGGYKIRRLIYNTRNNHLWLLCASSSSVDMDKVYVYFIGTDTLSSVATVAGTCRAQCAEVVDYNYTGSSFKYALVFTDYGNYTVDEITVSGTTLTRTSIFTGSVGPPNIRPVNRIIYIKNGNEVYFACSNDADCKMRKLHVSGAGAWVNDGELAGRSTYLFANLPAAYNYTDDRIYYYRSGIAIYSYQPGTDLTDTVVLNNIDGCTIMVSDGADRVFVNYHYSVTAKNYMAILAAGAGTEIFSGEAVDGIGPEPEPLRDVTVIFGGLSYDGSVLYGVDVHGRLFKYDTNISLFIETVKLDGMKVRGAIEKVCSSFNLVYKVSTSKAARVQRRSDENGDVITSGYSISLTADNMKDISDESFYSDAYDIIRISNGARETSFDGSIYDAVAFDQEKVLSVDSDWIPDEILDDLAFNMWPFFSVHHKVFLIPSPAALIQYECLDGATVVHTGKMSLNQAGVIISDSVDRYGRPEFKVLVNP